MEMKKTLPLLIILCTLNSQAQFNPEQVITTAADGAQFVYSADLDGDGDMDVLSASTGDDKIAWYENTSITVGLAERSEDLGISIYPNPSADQLFLNHSSGLLIHRIVIVNGIGQVVFESSGAAVLNIEELASGHYTVHVQTEKGTQVLAWVKW